MRINTKLIKKTLVAKDTWELEFENSNPEFYFNAGQYVWLITPLGRRAFSIVSPSNTPKKIKILFRQDNSEFKKYLLDLNTNDTVEMSGPHGSLRAPKEDSRSVYVAGGVGIAPFVSIISSLDQALLVRKITLIFANKDADSQFYVDQLKEIESRNKGLSIQFVLGKITKEVIRKINIKDDPDWYILGPQSMIDGVYEMLIQNKISEEKINFEESFPSVFKFNIDDDSNGSVFKKVVDQSANHVVLTDLNGNIIYANTSAQNLTGYTFSEMQNQTPRLWGGLMDPEMYKDFWKIIKKERKPYSGEIKNIKKNGDIYYVVATVSPIFDEKDNLVAFMGIEVDITESKKNKDELQRLSDLMINKIVEKKIDTKHE